MIAVQDDAVLVVVGIGRVLEEPRCSAQIERNEAVRLARGMIRPSCIALVLTAEQTFRIGGRLYEFRLCDVARILLGLREVDRHIEITVLRRRLPRDVPINARLADVVRCNAQTVVPVRCLLRRCRIMRAELPHDLRGTRHHTVHDARIEQVALVHRIFDQAACRRIVKHLLEHGRRRLERLIDGVRHILLHAEHVDQTVRGVHLIVRGDQPLLPRKMQEAADAALYVTHDSPPSVPIAVRMLLVPRPRRADDLLHVRKLRIPAEHRACLLA